MDIHIRREDKRLVTKVYRKETHTNRYLNWRSNHSKSFLLEIIKGQIHRAHYLCDLKEDLMEELSFLRDVFVMNSYPLKLVNEVIGKSSEKELIKAILREHPISTICHLKQKIPRMQQKNRVYKFDCADCKKWYIGEMGQTNGEQEIPTPK